jgi:class 3 adenylate cyclase
VIRQGGDCFGRTVNLASRIASHAAGGQVLVSERVAETTSVASVRFVGIGPTDLPGLPSPVNLSEARRI